MNLKYYFYELWSIFVDHGLPLIALLLIGILIPRIGRLAIRIIERRLDEDEESTKARLALITEGGASGGSTGGAGPGDAPVVDPDKRIEKADEVNSPGAGPEQMTPREGAGRTDIEVVAINDLGDPKTNAHLTQYDTAHGRFPGTVESGDDWIDVGLGKIKVTAERDPANLPHKDLSVDIAFECTGIFTSKDKASAHLTAGAKRVLVSAPADGADKTIVYGINHASLGKDDVVISNGSCTTNCLAPMALIMKRFDPNRTRGTLAGTFVLGTLISLIILALNGQISSTQVSAAAAYFPLIVIGLIAANYLNRFIDRHLLNRIVIIVAICAALMLIVESALL